MNTLRSHSMMRIFRQYVGKKPYVWNDDLFNGARSVSVAGWTKDSYKTMIDALTDYGFKAYVVEQTKYDYGCDLRLPLNPIYDKKHTTKYRLHIE